jgi:hypothetical protein
MKTHENQGNSGLFFGVLALLAKGILRKAAGINPGGKARPYDAGAFLSFFMFF